MSQGLSKSSSLSLIIVLIMIFLNGTPDICFICMQVRCNMILKSYMQIFIEKMILQWSVIITLQIPILFYFDILKVKLIRYRNNLIILISTKHR